MARTVRRTTKGQRPNLAFFFGAGAEVCYGLPAGGEFALEVLKAARTQVQAFKDYRARVDATCDAAYRDWLPDRFVVKQVSSLAGSDQDRVFDDSLRTGYERIINVLDDYDSIASKFLRGKGWSKDRVAAAFAALSSGRQLGDHIYRNVKIKRSISEATAKLFASRYFSAAIDLAKDSPVAEDMARLARSTIQLYLGAHGQGTVVSATDNPLDNAPVDNPAFQELGSMFEMHPLDAGASAFKAVMSHPPQAELSQGNVFQSIATLALESAVERFLDYSSIVDELFPALFRPRNSWAKFTKIFTFLMGAREYMLNKQKPALRSGDGYYHDVTASLSRITLTAVGTSNYTRLCDNALRTGAGGNVVHLNGTLDEFLDPYATELVPAAAASGVPRLLAPFLFTQSGIKPLTSVEVSRRYVDYYDTVVKSNAAVAVGFAFSAEDGHINSLFRQAIDKHNLHLIVLRYSPGGSVDREAATLEMARSLRVRTKANLTVLPVDENRRVEGRPWLNAVLEQL